MALDPLSNLSTPIYPTDPRLASSPALLLLSTVEDTTWTLSLWMCRKGASADFKGDTFSCWEVSKSKTAVFKAAKALREPDVVPFLAKAFDEDDMTLKRFKDVSQQIVDVVFRPSSDTPLTFTLTRVGLDASPAINLLESFCAASNTIKTLKRDGRAEAPAISSRVKVLEQELASVREKLKEEIRERGAIERELQRCKNSLKVNSSSTSLNRPPESSAVPTKRSASASRNDPYNASRSPSEATVGDKLFSHPITRNLGHPGRKKRIKSNKDFESSSDKD